MHEAQGPAGQQEGSWKLKQRGYGKTKECILFVSRIRAERVLSMDQKLDGKVFAGALSGSNKLIHLHGTVSTAGCITLRPAMLQRPSWHRLEAHASLSPAVQSMWLWRLCWQSCTFRQRTAPPSPPACCYESCKRPSSGSTLRALG